MSYRYGSNSNWTTGILNQVAKYSCATGYDCAGYYSCFECAPIVGSPQKRVQFSKPIVTKIWYHPSHTSLSVEERSLAWYSREDFQKFRVANRKQCLMLDVDEMEILWEDILTGIETQCNRSGIWWCSALETGEDDVISSGSYDAGFIRGTNSQQCMSEEIRQSRSMEQVSKAVRSHSPSRTYKKSLIKKFWKGRKVEPLNKQINARRTNKTQTQFHSI